MLFKYSQFNVVDELKAGVYSLYNTYLSKHFIVTLDPTLFSSKTFLKSETIPDLPEDVRNDLIGHEFIVPEKENELEKLKIKIMKDRKKYQRGLFLTLLPTLQCNFACTYCFENTELINAHHTMSYQTQKCILQFIEAQYHRHPEIQKIHIKWFGGEPLLAKNVLLNLSSRLREFAKTQKLDYQAILITNGYLIHRFSLEELRMLGLYAIQITLDGPAMIHDMRRPLKSGGRTFSRILKNLHLLVQNEFPVILRVNLDIQNAKSIIELFKLLKQEDLLSRFYQVDLRYVDTHIGKYAGQTSCSMRMNAKEITQLYKTASQHLWANDLLQFVSMAYPKFLSVACDAQIENHYAINAQGLVFKCVADATFQERSILNLQTGALINPERGVDLHRVSMTPHQACVRCALIPICHGGCPAQHLDFNHLDPACWPHCYFIHPLLMNLIKREQKCEIR